MGFDRKLKLWELSGMLTNTRTVGEVGFNKNGSFVDIWIRVNGEPRWCAVDAKELQKFLADTEQKNIILRARSDGNAEIV